MKAAICCFTLALVIACESINITDNKVKLGFPQNVTAYIYKNKETGKLIFCANKHTSDLSNFNYKGKVSMSRDKVFTCDLQ